MTGNLCVTIDKMIMVDIMGFMIEDVLILNVCLLIENVKRKCPDARAGFYISKSPVARGRFKPRQVIPRAKG